MKDVLEVIKLVAEIAAIITGIFVAIPLFRKKILDDKLNETLKKLNEINEQKLPSVLKLIDNYTYKEEYYGPIGYKEIQKIYRDFLNLKRELAFSQSEVATISSLLEGFIRRTIHWYKENKKFGRYHILERTDLYGIITKSLWDLQFFMLKDISIPSSTFIKKDLFVNDRIKKFTTKANYNKYKGFEIGYSSDRASSIFPLFLENVSKYGNEIYYKAILDIYGMDTQYSVIRLLYLHELYAPVLLKFSDCFCGNCYLCLIGFKEQRKLGSSTETVDLYYGNPIKRIGIEGIIQSFGIEQFKDAYLKFDNSLHDYKGLYKCGNDIFKIKFGKEILARDFSKYKYYIEIKMKNECNGIYE